MAPRFAGYTPTIEEVKKCHDRLMQAGGILPVETQSFTEDFYQCVIERAATFEVIEEARYWKAREQPLLGGLEHEVKPDPATDPLDDFPF